MVRWQYEVLKQDIERYEPLTGETLSTMGQNGWELVAVTHFADKLIYMFKRPTPSDVNALVRGSWRTGESS